MADTTCSIYSCKPMNAVNQSKCDHVAEHYEQIYIHLHSRRCYFLL